MGGDHRSAALTGVGAVLLVACCVATPAALGAAVGGVVDGFRGSWPRLRLPWSALS